MTDKTVMYAAVAAAVVIAAGVLFAFMTLGGHSLAPRVAPG
jgi:hypothetical protein